MVALRQSDMDFIAGQVVSETIERQGNALIETVAGNEALLQVVKSHVHFALFVLRFFRPQYILVSPSSKYE